MSDSMREQLEAAFENAEEETGGSPEDTSESTGAEEASVDTGAEESEAGGEEPADDTEGGGGEEAPTETGDEGGDDPAPAGDEGDVGGDKAPVSWKPGVREHWAKLPAEVKAEIGRRERDIQQGLQQSAGYKKIAQEYYQTVQPFQSFIQAAGNTPAQAIHQLMTTAAQLTQGSPAKKAEVVRNIINEYGVDIGMLDKVLSTGEVPQDENAPLLAAIDERLAPVQDFMGQISGFQQQNSEKMETDADESLATFAEANDYYEDLREDMADLLEMAANRGRPMSLEEAYERAGAAHPEIGPIMAQRAAARENKLDEKTVSKKKDAASSVRGSPTGQKSTGAEGSMRATMEEAWDDLAGDVGHG